MTLIKPQNISTDMTTDTELSAINVKLKASVGHFTMIDNTAATTISASNTYVKISGTTSANSNNKQVSHTSNKLTYTGTETKLFTATSSLSLSGTNGDDISIRIAKNGTTLSGSQIRVTISGNGHVEVLAVQSLISMATNDYLEMFITNNTSTNSVTVKNMSMLMVGLSYSDI
jgi:hypothetical protein